MRYDDKYDFSSVDFADLADHPNWTTFIKKTTYSPELLDLDKFEVAAELSLEEEEEVVIIAVEE